MLFLCVTHALEFAIKNDIKPKVSDFRAKMQ
jgi:hypothetical protein